MEFNLANKNVPDGTVLVFGISYESQGTGHLPQKVYTYVLLKANGLWHSSGSGKSPQAAGWGAVQAWLKRDGRKVEWVRMATGWAEIWSPGMNGVKAAGEPVIDEDLTTLQH